jgi:protein-L-isoaspartate(D-aspartate) O-methyltransferase
MDNEDLIAKLKNEGTLRTAALEKALRGAPRELFVPEDERRYAYVDEPLPIGEGQTISQPTTVVAMTEALDVKVGQKILEIGAGSGWQAALLAEMAGAKGFVWTIERLESLCGLAKANLRRAGIKNVKVVLGDGSLGLAANSPYDRIMVTAACPDIPTPLLEQLKVGGKMVLPVGNADVQEMLLVEKASRGASKKSLGGFRFVPLIGKYGFVRER